MRRPSRSAMRFSILFSLLALIILFSNGCKKESTIEKENLSTNILEDEDFLNWINTKRPQWLAYLLPVDDGTKKLNNDARVGILISNLDQLEVARLVYRNRLAAKLHVDTGKVELVLLKQYQDNATQLDSIVAKKLLFNKTWLGYKQLYLNAVRSPMSKTMGVRDRSDLGGIEIRACRVSHLYSLIQGLNNRVTNSDCFNLLGRINDLMSNMTSMSNPSNYECNQMELNVFSYIEQYTRCIVNSNPEIMGPGGSGGGGGGGGGQGDGATGPVFGENGKNAVVSLAKINELLAYVQSIGLNVTESFKTMIKVNGIEFEGEAFVIYDSENNVIAYYFTPSVDSATFPKGFYYSIGDARPNLAVQMYTFDFGNPIVGDDRGHYTGGTVDDIVGGYSAEWFTIEDSFGVLIAELAAQGITNGDPVPEMYYKNGTPIDMTNASPTQGRTVLGVPRNLDFFWKELYKKRPEMFSPDNVDKIFAKSKASSPIINEQWIRYNPHDRPYINTKLIHHHDKQGKFAYALSEVVHRKWHKVFHELRSKGGISKIKGRLNMLAGALSVFSILTDLKTGNPDGWVNWFGAQNIVGKIYKDNEKDVYFQITSKRETKNSSGTVISAIITYNVFADYIWDEDEKIYMGVQKLGTFTDNIDVINGKIISGSFEII